MGRHPWRKHYPDTEMAFCDLMGFEVSGFVQRFKDKCHSIHQVTGNGGYLSLNGMALDKDWVLQQLGPDIQRNDVLLKQMLDNKIIQRDEHGRLFSPDQVKEIYLSEVRARSGKVGGEATQEILLKQTLEEPSSILASDVSDDSVPLDGGMQGGSATSAADQAFDHWNSLANVQHHREFSKKAQGLLNSRLKKYTLDEVMQTFNTYDDVLASSDTNLDTKWPLDQFCQPDRFVKFSPGSDPWIFYKQHNKPSSGNHAASRTNKGSRGK